MGVAGNAADVKFLRYGAANPERVNSLERPERRPAREEPA
jgi:hypothetical protein